VAQTEIVNKVVLLPQRPIAQSLMRSRLSFSLRPAEGLRNAQLDLDIIRKRGNPDHSTNTRADLRSEISGLYAARDHRRSPMEVRVHIDRAVCSIGLRPRWVVHDEPILRARIGKGLPTATAGLLGHDA
jgi:hypothetical protein